MNKIRIITDSCSDIREENYANLTVLPITVQFGDEEYKDGIDITNEEFYKKLDECEELPTTSLISPAVYEDAYREAISNGEKVVVLTLSSGHSGTYQSAVLAATEFENDVFVVDSKNVCIGQQILVLYALQLIEKGMTAENVAKELCKARENIRLFAVLDSLEFLKKSGRISSSVAFFGGVLSIKPVVAVKNGKVELIGKARGTKNGNTAIIKEIRNAPNIDYSKPICFGYTGFSDDYIKNFANCSSEIWQGYKSQVPIVSVGAAMGTHLGPGAFGVAYFCEDTKADI